MLHYGYYDYTMGLMEALQESLEWGEVPYLKLLSETGRLHEIVSALHYKKCTEMTARARFQQWKEDIEELFPYLDGIRDMEWDTASEAVDELFQEMCECGGGDWSLFSEDLSTFIHLLGLIDDADIESFIESFIENVVPDPNLLVVAFVPDVGAFLVISSPYTGFGAAMERPYFPVGAVDADLPGEVAHYALSPELIERAGELDKEIEEAEVRREQQYHG